MALSVVGISHRSAPIEVRERFAIPPDAGEGVLAELLSAGCTEAVLLSTCNRTELYLYAPRTDVNGPVLGARMLCERSGMREQEAGSFLYSLGDRNVVRHLFRVVSSLDSMIVGEAQIQGQVREAYGRAIDIGADSLTVGPVLSRLFETALGVGARVRSDTHLGEGAASIPSAAVRLARQELGSLEGRRAVVLGAGEMSALMQRCLLSEGMRSVTVTNRTDSPSTANGNAVQFVAFDRLPALLEEVDLVAGATAAPHAVLTRSMVAHAMSRRSEPLLILDIALPRDVEPEAATVPGVRLYDLDDLDRVVTGTLERRRSAVEHAESIIDSGVDEFWAWFRARGVVPVIRELRGRAEELRQRELRRARRQLRNLTESEFEAVDGLTRQLLAKILHVPTSRLRDAAAEGRDEELLDAARYLFSIDDSPDDGEDA